MLPRLLQIQSHAKISSRHINTLLRVHLQNQSCRCCVRLYSSGKKVVWLGNFREVLRNRISYMKVRCYAAPLDARKKDTFVQLTKSKASSETNSDSKRLFCLATFEKWNLGSLCLILCVVLISLIEKMRNFGKVYMIPTSADRRINKLEDVYLRFYNGTTMEEYVDIRLCEANRLFETSGFKKNNPTVIYVHGFAEHAYRESVKDVVSAYLEARPATNVILLDWSNMSHGNYLSNASRNTKKVGAATAEQLNKLIEAGLPIGKLHIVGHSLGGHVAGYIGRELKKRYNKIVKRVTALDPAFPAFYPNGFYMQHVSAKDAEFVDVIHTDAGVYGAPVQTGTADFWPNGGRSVQPGCPYFAIIPLTPDNLCSHWRSWRYYAESVRRPKGFPASPAQSYKEFTYNPHPEVGMVYMGVDCDTKAEGCYYLTTNCEPPFGKGLDGSYNYCAS